VPDWTPRGEGGVQPVLGWAAVAVNGHGSGCGRAKVGTKGGRVHDDDEAINWTRPGGWETERLDENY
jgi:hypothetical protein